MAKLPNIKERERSLWTIIKFVLVESIRGSRKYSLMRYIAAGAGAAFAFVEFGALALIVNEFATRPLAEVRIIILIQGFIILALSDLLPSIAYSIHGYAWSIQMDDISRHLQKEEVLKMDELDIGTIEQPEFQNILDTVNARSKGSLYAIINTLTDSIRNIVSLIIATVSLVIISPPVALVIFAGALPTYFFERKSAVLSSKIWKESAEERRIWNAKMSPIMNKNSLIELKNFHIVKIFLKKFLHAIGLFHGRIKDLERRTLSTRILSRIVLTIAFGGAFALLIYNVYTGTILIGALVFSFSVVSRFQSSINQLFNNFARMAEHKNNVNVILDLLEMKPLIVSGTRDISPNTPITIAFKKVSFAYPGSGKKVLKNVSLTVAPGENLAIVGLNGAGKTTLIKLLTRVYDPTEGKILINNIPLPEYDLKAWRGCIGILMQDYSLYHEETVAENIMLGDISKHDQELVHATAQETTADEYIKELPKKYKQKIGTEFRGGVELSRGQKQKLALARVFYRDAPFLILDEPTAAIDAVSEDKIFTAIRERHPDQTRIIISHKFSNVRDADQIAVLKEGKIMEQGTHDSLIALSGEYARLFALQAKGYQ